MKSCSYRAFNIRLLQDHFSLPCMHIHTLAFLGAEVAVAEREGYFVGL